MNIITNKSLSYSLVEQNISLTIQHVLNTLDLAYTCVAYVIPSSIGGQCRCRSGSIFSPMVGLVKNRIHRVNPRNKVVNWHSTERQRLQKLPSVTWCLSHLDISGVVTGPQCAAMLNDAVQWVEDRCRTRRRPPYLLQNNTGSRLRLNSNWLKDRWHMMLPYFHITLYNNSTLKKYK